MDMAELMLLLAAVCTILIIRIVLILTGLYKAPILRSFEHYGEERIYSPLLYLVLWVGVAGWLLITFYFDSFCLYGTAFMLPFLVPAMYDRLYETAVQHPRIFLAFPAWYYALMDSTTREERRRVAYMWLRLPRGLRLHYSTNHHAFSLWVDLVLISVVS